jgi:chemotaxis protein CheD
MRHVVGIGDAAVSKDKADIIITHSLGSCIGIGIYDEAHGVGGILHYMLPFSSLDPVKAQANPLRFGDTAIPELFKMAYALGAEKSKMRVVMAGGANVLNNENLFDIGRRNIMIARKLFWKNRVLIDTEEVEGTIPRTLSLDMATGAFQLQSRGVKREF